MNRERERKVQYYPYDNIIGVIHGLMCRYNYQLVSDRFRRATRDGILTYASYIILLYYYTHNWVCVNRTDDEGQTRRSYFLLIRCLGWYILYRSEDGQCVAFG